MANAPQSPRPPLAAEAREAIRACSGWNSRLAARRIAKFLERRMEGCGLTLTQFALMAQIAAAEDDTIGGLSERMELDQSTLSRNLRALEAAALVEIAIVETDLRRRAVWLTEEGARRLAAATPYWRAAHEALAERMDAELAAKLAQAAARLEEA
ncbi:MAG: winged helix-turn-helix transcriptional regulator [Hyphomicrobiales bacterium]|nr:winged helix-turn-helix transcriptional regulator [Hyphomicrobiales bacterium]MBV8661736.1 winged helix-turn-helix transcriptional regulator [Hyphomicrobiales bacterium]